MIAARILGVQQERCSYKHDRLEQVAWYLYGNTAFVQIGQLDVYELLSGVYHAMLYLIVVNAAAKLSKSKGRSGGVEEVRAERKILQEQIGEIGRKTEI